MTARTYQYLYGHQDETYGDAPYAGDDAGNDGLGQEFFTGEPICPRPQRSAGSSMASALLVVAMLSGTGYAGLRYGPSLAGWTQSASLDSPAPAQATAPLAQPVQPEPATPPLSSAAAPAEPPPIEPTPVEPPREVATVPGSASGTPVTAAKDPAARDKLDDETAPAPLPPPAYDASDPLQKRAASAGLHPDLSRALLSRLTSADYRNAKAAIKTALAQTPDDGVYSWPQNAKTASAVFEVRFVAGAPANCRRYVVTVIKDRWSTTAPAMEKCATRANRNGAKTSAEG